MQQVRGATGLLAAPALMRLLVPLAVSLVAPAAATGPLRIRTEVLDHLSTQQQPPLPAARSAWVRRESRPGHPAPGAENWTNVTHRVNITQPDKSEWRTDIPQEAKFVLLSMMACFTLICGAIMVVYIYDLWLRWRHKAYVGSCERKVHRACEVLSKRKNELHLCPYCIEFLPRGRSSSKVVFHCGHCFHTRCANQWYDDHPKGTGHCPICHTCGAEAEGTLPAAGVPAADGQPSGVFYYARPAGAAAGEGDTSADGKAGPAGAAADGPDSGTAGDEEQCFMVHSLHRLFPDIIPAEFVQRWALCHARLWLTEFACPRYVSIFRKEEATCS